MSLTLQQLQTLKADIQSRHALWANGTQQVSNEDVAAFYNSTATPTVNVWKPEVTITELNSVIDWVSMTALTVEKQLAFQTMIWSFKIDMTDAQVRAGIDAIFGNPSATRTGILNVGKKAASYIEAMFSTGGAVKTSQMFGYKFQPGEVADALNS